MAYVKDARLDADDVFPPLQLQLLDGTSLAVPSDLNGPHAVLLIYRGEW